MGSRLSPPDAELYARVDEILFYKWDPIGVSDTPEARDEYASYFPVVFSMLKQGRSSSDIENYLSQIEQDNMGLKVSPKTRELNSQIGELLIEYQNYISEKFLRPNT